MPRPRKCRRVCHFPQNLAFGPVPEEREGFGDVSQLSSGRAPADGEGLGNASAPPDILMTLDEYETIRLIDYEGLSQEQCAGQMGVARTTVQFIYAEARKKLSSMLVEGRPLNIRGGDYRLCDGSDRLCAFHGCVMHPDNPMYQIPKGDHQMRIAVTYEEGQIFQHFGHTEFFKIYDAEDGKIISSQVVSTNGSGHGALAGVLNSLKADVLICGGIGGGAQMALAEAGIKLYGGVSGSADEAVESFLAGKLDFDPNVHCDHHGEHHHDGHACGDHGCGNHGEGHHCH